MLKFTSETEPTTEEILASEFIKYFLIEESVRGKFGQHALEQAMGKPFD